VTVRRLLAVGYVAHLLALLYLTLTPEADAAGSGVGAVTRAARALGATAVTAVHVEIALNVVLFVPLGLLGMLLFRRRWWTWVPVGLAVSLFIEGFQLLFLANRSATATDLVANTSGALAGALLGHLLSHPLDHRPTKRRRTASDSPTAPSNFAVSSSTRQRRQARRRDGQ
jgi:membrane associated rhomboid family serine protease